MTSILLLMFLMKSCAEVYASESRRSGALPDNLTHLEIKIKSRIEWQNQADAYRVAQRRAESTGKRHRLVDGDGRIVDHIQ